LKISGSKYHESLSGYESGKLFPEKIETMTKYSVEGHFLTLSDHQETMKFVAADWD
jgi:hypothetical protein